MPLLVLLLGTLLGWIRGRRSERTAPLAAVLTGAAVAILVAAAAWRGARYGFTVSAPFLGLALGLQATRFRLYLRPIVGRLSLSALSVVLFLGLLGVGELLCRRWAPQPIGGDTGHLQLQLWNNGPCYQVDVDLLGRQTLVPVAMQSRWTAPADSYPLTRPPDVRRIAIIGESSAGQMERMLSKVILEAGCGKRFQVLMCASPGGDLRQVEQRFQEVLQYSPDVISVIFGHNLFLTNTSSTLALRLQWLRSQSHLLANLFGVPPESPRVVPDEVERLRWLGEALHRFGEETRRRGVALVVSTMSSNLRFAPRPLEGEAASVEREARFLRDIGRAEEAEVALRKEPEASSTFALAEELSEQGRFDEARSLFWRAVDLDSERFRASEALNQVIREAARAGGFTVRETVADVTRRAPHGIPGWESFEDHCHLREEPLRREAMALFQTYPGASSCPVAAVPIPSDDPTTAWRKSLDSILQQVQHMGASAGRQLWLAQLPGLVAEGIAGAGAVEKELDDSLARGDFLGLPPDVQAQWVVGLAEGLFRGGRTAKAFALNEMARQRAQAPEIMASTWVQSGEFLLRQDRREDASVSFQKAAALAPEHGDSAFFLARLSTLSASH